MAKEARHWLHSIVLFCATASLAIAAEPAVRAQAVENASPTLAQRSPANPAAKPLHFVFITPCVREPFFEPVAEGAKDAAAMLDVRCEFRGTRDVDVPAQVELTRQAIVEGVDGIALNLIDATAFNEVIADAQRRGIAVIAFNCNAQPGSRVPTVGQQLYSAGRKAAFHAAPLIPDDSKVLITGHDGATLGADERTRGIIEGLKDKDLRLIKLPTNNVAEDVESAVAASLAADPQIRAIIATSNGNTEGVGRAVEKLGLAARCTVIGFDVSPEILRLLKADVVKFTIDQQPYAQGFYPVMQLTLARRMGIAPGNMDTGARVIRKQDIEAYLAQKN